MIHWLRKSISLRVYITFWLCITTLTAAVPPWWTERHVTLPTHEANDFGPINQGQLKHIARAAYLEMRGKLAGGAGPALDALVAGWVEPASHVNDYALMNLGQVKNLAKPFYDRLISENLVLGYPWTPNAANANDVALANIGQVKNLFAFTIPDQRTDMDRDGLLDAWEALHGLNGTNPWDGNSSTLNGVLPQSLESPEAPDLSYSSPGIYLDPGVPVNKTILDNDPGEDPSGSDNLVYSHEIITYLNGDGDLPSNIVEGSTGWQPGDSFSLYAADPRYDTGEWINGDWVSYVPPRFDENTGEELLQYVGGYYSGTPIKGYSQYGLVKVSCPGGATSNISIPFRADRYDASGNFTDSSNFTVNLNQGEDEVIAPSLAQVFPGHTQVYRVNSSPIPQSTYSISSSDGAGPRYRKIGLNGAPLSDSKPQAQDETGENPEETYIDAYTSELRHSVSDVYDSVGSSTLPLVVRRDVAPLSWNQRSGLRPSERPELAFGAGWSTNLCAHIKMVNTGGYMKVYVTDEQGATQMFVWDAAGQVWVPDKEEKQDVRTSFNRLEMIANEGVPLTFKYIKKYGATCSYTVKSVLTQNVAINRETGSGGLTTMYYARLDYVFDRQGNTLRYEYPETADYTLIPQRIWDPARPGREVRIKQEDGLITAVKGPDGVITQYAYGLTHPNEPNKRHSPILTSVSKGASTVSYGYFVRDEEDPTPDLTDPNRPPASEHIAVNKITDERGLDYQFELEFQHGITYDQVTDGNPVLRTQLGLAPKVKEIDLPNNTTTTFTSVRNIHVLALNDWSAEASMTVSGPGGSTTYTFSDPVQFVPVMVNPGEENVLSKHMTLTFSKLSITNAIGTESYEFDPNASFAVSKATDLSGNSTSFVYADGFDDPTMQTNALQEPRYFTYDAESRVMSSVTDERGVRTVYEVDSSTGLRLNEKVYFPANVLLKKSDFFYEDISFPAFMTRKIDYAATGPGIDTVITYTPDGQGRVYQQSVALGAGKAITTTTFYDAAGRKRTTVDANGNETHFGYDANGRLISVTNPDQSTKHLAYDAHGNLIQETAENGLVTAHVYDELNRRISSEMNVPALGGAPAVVLTTSTTYNGMNLPVTETDVRGRVTTHTYDAIGRRTKTEIDGPVALITEFTYGINSGGSTFDVSGFKPTSVKDARGFTSSVTYDKLYRPVTQTSAVDGTTTTAYDEVGNPVTVTDALGRVTETQYDGLNHPTVVTLPATVVGAPPVTRLASYTPSGLVLQTTDEMGRVSNTTYDAAGRAIEIQGPVLGGVRPTSRKSYDANGNVIAVQDPLGRITEMQYDNRNRPTKIIAPAVMDGLNGGQVRPETTTVYDVMGNPTEITDALGQITRKFYDGLNRVVKVQDALNQVVTSTYDEAGNVLTVTDALGHVTTNTYDIHNRLIQTLDAAGQTTTFGYDEGGNRTSITDSLQHTSTFTYDGLNRVLTEAPGGNTYTYNKLQKLTRKDSGNKTITYAYDARDRVISETGSGLSRQYAYNLLGQLLTVTESNANVTYGYDVLGRVIQETSNGVTHTYGYDLAGNRVSTVYGGTNRNVVSHYDNANRLIGLQDGPRITRWFYDLGGRMVGQLQANGQYVANSYDAVGRLKVRKLHESVEQDVAGLAAEFTWQHDAAGNVTQQSERWPWVPERADSGREKTTVMAYDAVYRLLSETVTGTGQSTEQTTYAYDAGNNRSSRMRSTGGILTEQSSYTYNALNQLTSWATLNGAEVLMKSAALTYDAAGNRTKEIVTIGGVASTTSYTWDRQNRLTKVVMPNGGMHRYVYDYRTRRIVEAVNSFSYSPTKYRVVVYSGGLGVQEHHNLTNLIIVNPAAPTVENQRSDGMGGGVGGMLYSLRGGQTKFSLSNGRGDVVAQSDSQGAVTWTASYEAYGKRTKETGTNLDRQRANTKEEDPTGLLNEGFRYRDLETGVWLSRDPAGFVDGPNLYAYVRQNPWTAFDPDGLELKATTNTRKNEKTGKEYRHTHIEINAVLIDRSRGAVTRAQDGKAGFVKRDTNDMEALAERIKTSIEKQWTVVNKDKATGEITRSSEAVVNLKVAQSSKDINLRNDHVIYIVNDVPDLPGTAVAGTVDNVGGKWMAIESTVAENAAGRSTIEWTAGHESGHWLGLRHPAPDPGKALRPGLDNTNPIKKLSPLNIMDYSGGTNVDNQQLDRIQKDYDEERLNKQPDVWRGGVPKMQP